MRGLEIIYGNASSEVVLPRATKGYLRGGTLRGGAAAAVLTVFDGPSTGNKRLAISATPLGESKDIVLQGDTVLPFSDGLGVVLVGGGADFTLYWEKAVGQT